MSVLSNHYPLDGAVAAKLSFQILLVGIVAETGNEQCL